MRSDQIYQDFQLDEFVADDFFIKWTLDPDFHANAFWTAFLESNPDKGPVVSQAQEIVRRLHESQKEQLDPSLLGETWRQIEIAAADSNHFKTRTYWMTRWQLAAACLVGVLILTGLYFAQSTADDSSTTNFKTASWQVIDNTSAQVKRVTLSDGSTVTLEPKSTIRFPDPFSPEMRLLIMSGEAFFDIKRDTTKPFLVYTDHAVIRALGTSFLVEASPNSDQVEVVVKTGKVAVYQRSTGHSQIQQAKHYPSNTPPMLVTTNQKVVYDKNRQELTKRLTTTPTLVQPLHTLPKLRFDGKPVIEVFDAIAEAYGIKIRYDDQALMNCTVTTTLTDQTMFEKLDIICASLGLGYLEEDAAILIQGKCDR